MLLRTEKNILQIEFLPSFLLHSFLEYPLAIIGLRKNTYKEATLYSISKARSSYDYNCV